MIWSNKNSHTLLMVMQNTVATLGKIVWWFFSKLNTVLPYDPLVVLLDIYPKGNETMSIHKTCIEMFIAAYS